MPAEALKANLVTATEIQHRFFEKVDGRKLPGHRKEGFSIRLPKTGDLKYYKNYRRIMLLSVPGQGLNKILLERMKTAVDSKLCDNQAVSDRTGHVLTTLLMLHYT